MVPPVLSNLWKSSKFKYGLIVLALIISSYFLYEGWPAGQKEKKLHPPVVVSSTIVIDTTEDERALGYSGQKKMAQDLQGNLYIGYRKKFNQIYQVYVAKVIKERTGTWQVTHTDQPISSITNKTNQRVTVSYHSKDIKRGTLQNILKQAGINMDEFIKLLKK
ncbi:MAG: hypothetical protein UU26_C0018G0002 [Candidatus Daviesbacteria bacterium GW2011_GWC1_40_9]|nr:MAG: hypothetical protein UU26_C0018G0002 [Candidatus Daviesbacteria bacterium GW2011_GWC1_40_9]